jgi:hypothetical protein
MNLEFNFVVDSTIKGRIYPALAIHQGRPYTQSWREFGQHWPYTTPLRLEEYCREHGVTINNYAIDTDYPNNSYYPICLGFFDFNINYFELLPPAVKSAVESGRLKVLFMYHEGDNPRRIKARLDSLRGSSWYQFVSANSAADQLPGFVTFHEIELWYYQRNQSALPLRPHTNIREREFTALVRLHRWWRATAMADLHTQGLLDNAYWSYCEPASGEEDSPIEVDMIPRLRWNRERFMANMPYIIDEMSQDQRNDHSQLEPKYHLNSYCNIVLESQFDVDQSGGTYITEKTFKPIKHGQMFFIAGAAGSLQVLRELGYRVFDGILDNRYDQETSPTLRWQRLVEAINTARPCLHELNIQAQGDIVHNQELFMASKRERLNTLIRRLHEQRN